MRILVVEDHEELRSAIVRRLRAAGNSVDEGETCQQAFTFIQAVNYDVVVLDRMLPDGDSASVLKKLRQKEKETPVLLLTAMDKLDERVAGFEAGADDYLVKPFAMEELLVRLRALARRKGSIRASVLHIGDITLDSASREVRRAGVLIPLRPKEYTLLEWLATHLDSVVSRQSIVDCCWDQSEDPSSNVEEVLIASLRRKLGKPAVIHTVRGSGYMLKLSNEKDEA